MGEAWTMNYIGLDPLGVCRLPIKVQPLDKTFETIGIISSSPNQTQWAKTVINPCTNDLKFFQETIWKMLKVSHCNLHPIFLTSIRSTNVVPSTHHIICGALRAQFPQHHSLPTKSLLSFVKPSFLDKSASGTAFPTILKHWIISTYLTNSNHTSSD